MADLKSIGSVAGSIALNTGKVVAATSKAGSEAALNVIDTVQRNSARVAETAKKNPHKAGVAVGVGVTLAAASGIAAGVSAAKKRDYHNAGRTASGRAKVYNIKDASGMPVRVLSVGGVLQSATYLEEDTKYLLPFAYYRAFDVVYQEGIAHDRLLLLGGGGCTFPKHVLAEDETTCIDVIEPDPSMTSIAREYFFLDDAISQFDADGKRLHIISEPGAAFLRRRAALVEAEMTGHSKPVAAIVGGVTKAIGKVAPKMTGNLNVPLRYDAIINDAFEGRRPCTSLLTHEVLLDAKACLNDGGLYLINVADPGKKDVYLREIMTWLSNAFAYVHVVPCADVHFGAKDSCLLVATDGEYVFPGETQVQTGKSVLFPEAWLESLEEDEEVAAEADAEVEADGEAKADDEAVDADEAAEAAEAAEKDEQEQPAA